MADDTGRLGRPRSEEARVAVLHAVDDLLLEVGYAALTMKGIAERAGVGRQTVYRWWSTKAEVLFEASVADARKELAVAPRNSSLRELSAYLEALTTFLTVSAAGAAYRALVAAAQQDDAVAELLATVDLLGDSARTVLARVAEREGVSRSLDQAAALLVGPTFFWAMSGHAAPPLNPKKLAEAVLHDLRSTSRAR